jgi:hypothetical protein
MELLMIANVHERTLTPDADPGALLDRLATEDDPLWPVATWPAIRFDRPLSVGARGGHGPVHYDVDGYLPGRWVRFRFTAPRGFHGYHEYRVLDGADRPILRHTLVMRTAGPARLTWPLIYRPMHDALIEDSLVRATGEDPPRWSRWVRFLRALAGRRRFAVHASP